MAFSDKTVRDSIEQHAYQRALCVHAQRVSSTSARLRVSYRRLAATAVRQNVTQTVISEALRAVIIAP
jgi:hypothetical protein